MSGWGWGLGFWRCSRELLLTLAGVFHRQRSTCRVPQGCRLPGRALFPADLLWRWQRDDRNPQRCPLVIHLADGDMAAEDLAGTLAQAGPVTDEQEMAKGLANLEHRR